LLFLSLALGLAPSLSLFGNVNVYEDGIGNVHVDSPHGTRD
jgi:hypothetical protein